MHETLVKKCTFCNENESINFDNLNDFHLVCYKNKYYHRNCFMQMCEKRVAKNDRYSLSYKEALQDVDVLEKEAYARIITQISKDALNNHLIDKYNVAAIPARFWATIADIENGKYNKKKCHKITTHTIYNVWLYFQHDLDEIAKRNKSYNKGPNNDSERLNYDLSIILQKVPEYRKIKAKEEAVSAQMSNEIKQKKEQINYDKLSNKEKCDNIDIVSLMDDIF